MRSTIALLATATATALLSAPTGLLAAPASAGDAAVPVYCGDGVTISGDDMTYQLEGSCGVVRITASHATVRMPAATKLVVRGDHNTVHAKPVQRLRILGHDQRVDVRSAKTARIASPGSRVHIDGLLEHARVPGRGAHLHADQISTLVVGGNRNTISARRGFDARLRGDHNHAAWRRLDELHVPGDSNDVVVRRGSTRTGVSGTGNSVHVNHRG